MRLSATPGKTAPSYYQVNVYAATQHGDQRFDPVLRNGDKVFVPEIAELRPYRTPPFVPTD